MRKRRLPLFWGYIAISHLSSRKLDDDGSDGDDHVGGIGGGDGNGRWGMV